MNILLRTLGGRQWMGGVSYIINLVRAIRTADPDTKIFHLGHVSDIYEGKVEFDGIVMESSFHRRGRLSPLNILRRIRHGQPVLPRTDPSPDIDVAFALFDSEFAFPFPSIQWIPDFQHKHFPENFSSEEIASRDEIYSQFAKEAPTVVLSSETARRDFITYFPESAAKSRVLRFVKAYTDKELIAEHTYVSDKYNLPQSFFYLPNQFWKHKNHLLVIEALRLLKNRNIYPNVVFTGHTYDYRYPGYFDDFLRAASEYGLHRQLFFLGIVPYGDMLALMKQAHAIVNPSLCEGWSTTVEESKSLCKRIILSDIDVHKEQAPGKGRYFISGSAESLAEAIQSVSGEEIDVFDEQEARKSIEPRLKAFGQTFLDICRDSSGSRNSR